MSKIRRNKLVNFDTPLTGETFEGKESCRFQNGKKKIILTVDHPILYYREVKQHVFLNEHC